MREIKFRAWDAYRKRIYEVIEINWLSESIKVCGDFAGYRYTNIKSAILMQYTGLKDKNGKEIYEGDIIKTFGLLDNITGPVEFSDYKLTWQIHPSHWNEDVGFELFDIRVHLEVIGNIYENPELLELGPPHDKVV